MANVSFKRPKQDPKYDRCNELADILEAKIDDSKRYIAVNKILAREIVDALRRCSK